jgi:hypothetical protein
MAADIWAEVDTEVSDKVGTWEVVIWVEVVIWEVGTWAVDTEVSEKVGTWEVDTWEVDIWEEDTWVEGTWVEVVIWEVSEKDTWAADTWVEGIWVEGTWEAVDTLDQSMDMGEVITDP